MWAVNSVLRVTLWPLDPAFFEAFRLLGCLFSVHVKSVIRSTIHWCHHGTSSDVIRIIQWCHQDHPVMSSWIIRIIQWHNFLFLQVGLKLIAFRLKFFLPAVRVFKINNKIEFRYYLISFEVFDAMVVVISWILDIASLWACAVVSGRGQWMCSLGWASAWCTHMVTGGLS